ncbi:hypothetical protein J8G26_12180 [Acidovorax sp. JG5]|uniref:hypothetical protein n=1 Tax=Acidovorax sp. JG5 TaxID=2822718 RepID=UPI001B322D05|nr:hypothetical protein [Acidovorax sp. JG5]MBP3981487.1 hypothetical protein [Acidovorax sp. JG5]
MTAQLDPEAKTGNLNLTTSANYEKAQRYGGGAILKNDSWWRLLLRAGCQKGLKQAQRPKAKPDTRQKPQRINA